MKYFVFRNQTIEYLWGDMHVTFSGYDDISRVPDDVDVYIWFYKVPLNFDSAQLKREIESYFEKLQLVYSLSNKNSSFLVFTLEDIINSRFIGSDCSVVSSILDFNSRIIHFASQHSNIKLIDFKEFIKHYPSELLVNWKFYFVSQSQLNIKLAKDFSCWFFRKMDEIALKRKKCLVLDLDNTLWGGILGEDGINGIQVGGDYPGKAFFYWQKALLELNKSGVIFAVCSKNNENDVLEAWEKNPFIILKKKHFSAYRINWKDKASNIMELADELNIGLDSMVFIDDNPTEREWVRQMLPMVEVPDFPHKPYNLIPFYVNVVSQYFRIYSVTEEDSHKAEQYRANALRDTEKSKFDNYDDYLRSLDIKIDIASANDFNIQRIAQMTQKTNQFNLTTRRYTEVDIQKMLANGWLVYCMDVKDRFGDNGITGAVILKPFDDIKIEIDSLLLSCRVLGKGIEFAFLNYILNLLKNSGYNWVYSTYIPTAKNSQVADFYDKLDFKVMECNDNIKKYQIELNKKLSISDIYTIKLI